MWDIKEEEGEEEKEGKELLSSEPCGI